MGLGQRKKETPSIKRQLFSCASGQESKRDSNSMVPRSSQQQTSLPAGKEGVVYDITKF